MKKITTTIALTASVLAFSQVGIATPAPHTRADLELGSSNKALYLNRVANSATTIINPQPGMLVYDTYFHCPTSNWNACPLYQELILKLLPGHYARL